MRDSASCARPFAIPPRSEETPQCCFALRLRLHRLRAVSWLLIDCSIMSGQFTDGITSARTRHEAASCGSGLRFKGLQAAPPKLGERVGHRRCSCGRDRGMHRQPEVNVETLPLGSLRRWSRKEMRATREDRETSPVRAAWNTQLGPRALTRTNRRCSHDGSARFPKPVSTNLQRDQRRAAHREDCPHQARGLQADCSSRRAFERAGCRRTSPARETPVGCTSPRCQSGSREPVANAWEFGAQARQRDPRQSRSQAQQSPSGREIARDIENERTLTIARMHLDTAAAISRCREPGRRGGEAA